MTKEELITFLQENLSIDISVKTEPYCYDNTKEIKVTLTLDGEEISTSSSTITLPERTAIC